MGRYIESDELLNEEYSQYINDNTKEIIEEFKKYGGIDEDILKLLPQLHCKSLGLAEKLLPLIQGDADISWYKLIWEMPHLTKKNIDMSYNLSYINEIVRAFDKGLDVNVVKEALTDCELPVHFCKKINLLLNISSEELEKEQIESIESVETALKGLTDAHEENVNLNGQLEVMYQKKLAEKNERIKELNAEISELRVFNSKQGETSKMEIILKNLTQMVVDSQREIFKLNKIIEKIYAEMDNGNFKIFLTEKFSSIENKIGKIAIDNSVVPEFIGLDDDFKEKDEISGNEFEEVPQTDKNPEFEIDDSKETINSEETSADKFQDDIPSDIMTESNNYVFEGNSKNVIIAFFENLKKNCLIKKFNKLSKSGQEQKIKAICLANKYKVPMIRYINNSIKNGTSLEFLYQLLIDKELTLDELKELVSAETGEMA